MDIGDVVYPRRAMRRWFEIKIHIPIRFDGMTGEDIQEQGHCRPNYEKKTDEPSRDSELKIDTEDVIDEQEKGKFGQHGSQDIEVGLNSTRLLTSALLSTEFYHVRIADR